jgi:hypothetical protein
MDTNTLNQFIKKTLETYDKKQELQSYLLKDANIKIINTSEIMFTIKNSTKDSKIFNYEILGYHDTQTHTWIWSWLISDLTIEQTQLARQLLNYGLKLDSKSGGVEHAIIKPILVNSTIQIIEPVQLEVNIAIYSYLLSRNILCIYKEIDLNDDNPLTSKIYYYLIKNNI